MCKEERQAKQLRYLEEIKDHAQNDLHFHWPKFFVGIAKLWTAKEFIAFVTFTVIFILSHVMNWTNGHSHWFTVGYIIVTCLFILKGAIESLIINIGKRAEFKIAAQLNAGLPK